MDAQGAVPFIDAVETISGADARPDILLAALHHFLRNVRIGEVGSGHAHEVDLALTDRVPSRRHLEGVTEHFIATPNALPVTLPDTATRSMG